MADDGTQSWYDTAEGYMYAIGGTAREAVTEVYSDATAAAGAGITTISDVLKAPGKALISVGSGFEKAGAGIGKGAEEAGEKFGYVVPVAVLLAGTGLYLATKK